MEPSDLSRAELERLVEHLPYFVVVIDHDRRYLWVNRLDPTLDPADVLGKPIEAFTSDEHKGRVIEAAERALEGQMTYYEARAYGHGRYGTWYGCRMVPLPPDSQGRPRAMVLSHDVSERRRTAIALQESEARFRSLVESSPDFIAMIDRARRVLYVNRDPRDTRAPRVELMGAPVERLVPEVERAVAVATIERVFATRMPGGYDSGAVGSERRFRVSVNPLLGGPDSDGPRLLLVWRDITEAVRAERQREAMIAELDHRVKNSLATVVAIAHQTLARVDSLPAFAEAFSGRIRAMARTHERLAAASWAPVPLSELLVLALGPFCAQPDRHIEVVAVPPLPPSVATPVSLALHELSANAAKHGALTSGCGALSVRASLSPEGHLELDWNERGVAPPQDDVDGLGRQLVRGLIEGELQGRTQLQHDAHGLRYRLVIPLVERVARVRGDDGDG